MRPVRARGWTAICAGTRSMQFVSMSRQVGFSSPVATVGPRSASRRSPASIALGHRPGRSPLRIMGSAGGRLLSQGRTARSRQPLSRGCVPAPTRRVAPGRAGPSREICRCAPSTISLGHRCPVLRDRVASLRGKYISQPLVDALLSLYRRHVTRADTRLGLATGLTTWGQRRGRRSVEESRARSPLYTGGALASGVSAARARGSVPRWVGSAWLPRDRRDGSRLSAALLILESRLRRYVIHGFGTR
jgi:hypothetical protein